VGKHHRQSEEQTPSLRCSLSYTQETLRPAGRTHTNTGETSVERMEDCRMEDCRMEDCRMEDCRMEESMGANAVIEVVFSAHTPLGRDTWGELLRAIAPPNPTGPHPP